MTPKEYVLRVMRDAQGDDLERATLSFRGLSNKQMQEQHGQSGLTRQQVLDEYREQRRLHRAAIDWLKSI
jgi:hypothetical protein